MEARVDCFEEDGPGRGQRGVVAEQVFGFNGIRHAWLFKQDVFAGLDGTHAPFVVLAVGQRVVDCVDGGVVEHIYSRWKLATRSKSDLIESL